MADTYNEIFDDGTTMTRSDGQPTYCGRAAPGYATSEAKWQIVKYFYTSKSYSAWAASTAYNLNDEVEPTTPNGYFYVCTSAGTSGSSEPTWPTTEEATVGDGTATWTCHKKQDKNIKKIYANGDAGFVHIYDNRATFTYTPTGS